MRNAWKHKLQLSGPTVHSLYCVFVIIHQTKTSLDTCTLIAMKNIMELDDRPKFSRAKILLQVSKTHRSEENRVKTLSQSLCDFVL